MVCNINPCDHQSKKLAFSSIYILWFWKGSLIFLLYWDAENGGTSCMLHDKNFVSRQLSWSSSHMPVLWHCLGSKNLLTLCVQTQHLFFTSCRTLLTNCWLTSAWTCLYKNTHINTHMHINAFVSPHRQGAHWSCCLSCMCLIVLLHNAPCHPKTKHVLVCLGDYACIHSHWNHSTKSVYIMFTDGNRTQQPC